MFIHTYMQIVVNVQDFGATVDKITDIFLKEEMNSVFKDKIL